MPRLLLCLLTAAALVAAPATALAAPPWSAPVTVPNALGSSTPIVVAPAGNAEVLVPVSRTALGSTDAARSELVALGPDGTTGTGRPVGVAAGLLATYAKNRVAVAGSTLIDGTITDRSRSAVALGAAGGQLGPARGLTGSTGQHVMGMAGNAEGDLALVTGDPSHVRTLYVRRAGTSTFRVALRIAVSSRARGATVALGPTGDVLVVWEDHHAIFARHLASHRDAGALAFGAPEQISDNGESAATAPFAALDPVSGRSFVAYAPLGGVKVSARP